MSRQRIMLVAVSVAVAVLFGLAVTKQWAREVPGLACENFGCIGLGVLEFAVGCAVPVVFSVVALVVNKERRVARALEAFGVSASCMVACAAVLWWQSHQQTAQGCQRAVEACAAEPKLCTEIDLAAYRACAK